MSDVETPRAPDRLRLTVPDMDCPSCLATISDRLRKVPGVSGVEGSPMRRELEIVFDGRVAAPAGLKGEVERLGYRAESREPEDAPGATARRSASSDRSRNLDGRAGPHRVRVGGPLRARGHAAPDGDRPPCRGDTVP